MSGAYTLAREILENPAYSMDPRASYTLGVIYMEGHGVDPDMDKAVARFKIAAADINVDAMINLGSIYYEGMLGSVDFKEAYRWYLEAAYLGDAQAVSALSTMHFKGEIFPPDSSAGGRLALLARQLGWEYETEFFDYIMSDFSERKINQLSKEAESCNSLDANTCELIETIETKQAYIRTSAVKFMKFDKGIFFDSWSPEPIDGVFNHFIRQKQELPTFFGKQKTRLFKGSNKPDICQVNGKSMGLVWYFDRDMPDGKALEFGDKDYIEFECQEVELSIQ